MKRICCSNTDDTGYKMARLDPLASLHVGNAELLPEPAGRHRRLEEGSRGLRRIREQHRQIVDKYFQSSQLFLRTKGPVAECLEKIVKCQEEAQCHLAQVQDLLSSAEYLGESKKMVNLGKRIHSVVSGSKSLAKRLVRAAYIAPISPSNMQRQALVQALPKPTDCGKPMPVREIRAKYLIHVTRPNAEAAFAIAKHGVLTKSAPFPVELHTAMAVLANYALCCGNSEMAEVYFTFLTDTDSFLDKEDTIPAVSE